MDVFNDNIEVPVLFLPKCDYCERDAFAICYIEMEAHRVCTDHYVEYGCEVGENKGKILKVYAPNKVNVLVNIKNGKYLTGDKNADAMNLKKDLELQFYVYDDDKKNAIWNAIGSVALYFENLEDLYFAYKDLVKYLK